MRLPFLVIWCHIDGTSGVTQDSVTFPTLDELLEALTSKDGNVEKKKEPSDPFGPRDYFEVKPTASSVTLPKFDWDAPNLASKSITFSQIKPIHETVAHQSNSQLHGLPSSFAAAAFRGPKGNTTEPQSIEKVMKIQEAQRALDTTRDTAKSELAKMKEQHKQEEEKMRSDVQQSIEHANTEMKNKEKTYTEIQERHRKFWEETVSKQKEDLESLVKTLKKEEDIMHTKHDEEQDAIRKQLTELGSAVLKTSQDEKDRQKAEKSAEDKQKNTGADDDASEVEESASGDDSDDADEKTKSKSDRKGGSDSDSPEEKKDITNRDDASGEGEKKDKHGAHEASKPDDKSGSDKKESKKGSNEHVGDDINNPRAKARIRLGRRGVSRDAPVALMILCSVRNLAGRTPNVGAAACLPKKVTQVVESTLKTKFYQ